MQAERVGERGETNRASHRVKKERLPGYVQGYSMYTRGGQVIARDGRTKEQTTHKTNKKGKQQEEKKQPKKRGGYAPGQSAVRGVRTLSFKIVWLYEPKLRREGNSWFCPIAECHTYLFLIVCHSFS